MSEKPYRVRLNEALTGDLPVPGGKSMFRILLDEETVGAKISPSWSTSSTRD